MLLNDWHPADIKAALAKEKTSLAALARQHGVTNSVLSIALKRSFPKWERIIASAIGQDPRIIWPRRFAERDAELARRARRSAEIEAAKNRPRRRGRPPIRTTPDAAAARAGLPR
ncbi:MAG: helix-turn-helix domain-containing protein [Sphingomonadales bacterium]|jgi:Ner family transcriptional regulator